jgi:oligoribonuclease (3'-5' exoribonuclease)
MKPKPELLLWAHVATTGLDPDEDQILEVYMRLTDMHAEKTLGVYYECVQCRGPWMLTDEKVVRIHTHSGLLADCEKSRVSEYHISREVRGCLRDYPNHTIYLAGYAPAFTRQFLDKLSPPPVASLHFQNMDVTSIEKFLHASQGAEIYRRPEAVRVKAKVDAAVDQYRYYLDMMEALSG